MRKLIIDEYGAKVHCNSYSFPFDQTLDVAISRLLHPERLEVWPLRLPPPQPPPGETNLGTLGSGHYVDRIPTLEEAANDILRRDNGDLRREIEGLHESIHEYADQLRKSEEERKGLRADVKQAESHYEATSKRAEILRMQMAAVASVLAGTNVELDPDSYSPTLKVAREVVASSKRRWELYRQTMDLLTALAADIALIRSAFKQ